eukprot:453721_1
MQMYHKVLTCDPASGECVSNNVPEGTPCDDGNLCTVNSICSGGSCGSGVNIECDDDGNDCTTNTCDPASGECVSNNVPEGTPCDDGNLCTVNSICSGGSCY